MKKVFIGLVGLLFIGGGCSVPTPEKVIEKPKEFVTYTNTLGKYTIKHPKLFLHDKATDAAPADAKTELVEVLKQDESQPYNKSSQPLVLLRHLRDSHYPETQIGLLRADYLPNNKNVKVESVKINGRSMWQMLNQESTVRPGQNHRVLLWGDMVIVQPAPDSLSDEIIQTIDYLK